ncbi:MAG: anhydro-N-acetylmuramic acid kinase [Plectolyngbya sp. WJT66-NPBG17]|jgi:anhydro-N-acetylmuramic acid kinase|nr:anhydro-N-acetylmuramic acid kinase [Plectolyngbya sp. WJT66-NPBG17]
MRVIGLMSGTSVDGIDAALVEITGSTEDLQATLIAGETYPYPAKLRDLILSVCSGTALSIAELAELDDVIAAQFAQAALQIQANQTPAVLIGSHGQTVFHRPPSDRLGYSLQLGRGAAISHQTNIATISNFRAADIAIGGQGAPLVPPIDAAFLRHPIEHRCVQNIGGIGNVTYLPPVKSGLPIRGWDTGAGNMLIDLAVQQFSDQTYDRDGAWAASGTPNQELVYRWLQQDFFQQLPPKSTGREQFGQEYLNACLIDAATLNQADILATLTEFTVASIAQSYKAFLPQLPDRVLICGGGSRNTYLKSRLQALLPDSIVTTTDEAGLNADFKEAIAFAILAYWRYHGIPGNLPEVTGAPKPVLLGEIHHVG